MPDVGLGSLTPPTIRGPSSKPLPRSAMEAHHNRVLGLQKQRSVLWGVQNATSSGCRPLPYRLDIVNRTSPWSSRSATPSPRKNFLSPTLASVGNSSREYLPDLLVPNPSSATLMTSASLWSVQGLDAPELAPEVRHGLVAQRLHLVREQALIRERLETVRRRNHAAPGVEPGNGRLDASTPAVRSFGRTEKLLSTSPLVSRSPSPGASEKREEGIYAGETGV